MQIQSQKTRMDVRSVFEEYGTICDEQPDILIFRFEGLKRKIAKIRATLKAHDIQITIRNTEMDHHDHVEHGGES